MEKKNISTELAAHDKNLQKRIKKIII